MSREVCALPIRTQKFRHVHIVMPHRVLTEDSPIAPPWGECVSERGQPVCSCGRYALRWDASGIETIFIGEE